MPKEVKARSMFLNASNIVYRYDGVLAVDNICLQISDGAFLSVFGANGAGKSTLGMILSGILVPSRGKVSISDGSTKGNSRNSVRLIPEGRRLFGQLSVRENLLLGGYGAGLGLREIQSRIDETMMGLPKTLQENPDRAAAMLSGGEQQMLAIGRALMARPKLLIIDEPSMGLAPILVKQIYDVLRQLNQDGMMVILLEQMPTHAIRYSDTVMVLDRGKTVYSGPPDLAATNAALLEGYVGSGGK